MFAAGRGKVGHLDSPSVCSSRDLISSGRVKAAFIAALPRKAAEIADRLEMDAPHDGGSCRACRLWPR